MKLNEGWIDMSTASISELTEQVNQKTLGEIRDRKPVFWANDSHVPFKNIQGQLDISILDIKDAEERLKRFAPFIKTVFEDTVELNGLIESPISEISEFKATLEETYDFTFPGQFLLKRDDLLPIAGTIKARGAIYEVLRHAEALAFENKLLAGYDDDYTQFVSEEFQRFFNQYTVVVGTTGNLGISSGVMSAKIGFNVQVHMSHEAKQWKKDYLRSHGVQVIEHKTNFTEAVEQGRQSALADPYAYFIDDEHSVQLFLGYTTAASRLEKQLEAQGITVDAEHPLMVYLPCGVGGSPGGITFGLKQIYGDNVHCFFAQPTHVPSMMLGLISKKFSEISVYDFGIDGLTIMDGLAVPRTSQIVAELMSDIFNGGYTLTDKESNRMLTTLKDEEDIFLEPAATAGLVGPQRLFATKAGQQYLKDKGLMNKVENMTHIAWATGGSMVPAEEQTLFYENGLANQ